MQTKIVLKKLILNDYFLNFQDQKNLKKCLPVQRDWNRWEHSEDHRRQELPIEKILDLKKYKRN